MPNIYENYFPYLLQNFINHTYNTVKLHRYQMSSICTIHDLLNIAHIYIKNVTRIINLRNDLYFLQCVIIHISNIVHFDNC